MPVKKSNKYDNSRFIDMGPIVVTKRPNKAEKPKKGKNDAKSK